jgi:hypothetical protein
VPPVQVTVASDWHVLAPGPRVQHADPSVKAEGHEREASKLWGELTPRQR